MSQHLGDYPPPPASGPGRGPGQVARDEATDVGRSAADAGRHVAGTAAEQAGQVAQEAKAQARDFLGEARGQIQSQARTGQDKAAGGIRALSQELREMADGGQQSGTASELARQAADRADQVADWLGRREPGDLVEEVRSFARRRPGAFLIGAALAGVVVGRLTRGAVDSARDDSGRTPQHAYGTPRSTYPAGPPSPYTEPGLPPAVPAAGGTTGGYGTGAYPPGPSYAAAPPAAGEPTDEFLAPPTGTPGYADDPGRIGTDRRDPLDDPLRPAPREAR